MNDSIEAQDKAAQEVLRQLHIDVPEADKNTMRLLLTEARSVNGWQDKPVTDEQLVELYDILKWGSTSMNQQPGRYLFLRSSEAKEKLKPAVFEGNHKKTLSAPVVAIICQDPAFYENLPRVFPPKAEARDMFANNEAAAQANATRNGTLQGAYFMIAARSMGLDCGPMSGFNNAMVDELFLAERGWKSNFLCNLGYGDTTTIFRRMPRLEFADVAAII